MKTAALPLAVSFKIACGIAYAQGSSDQMQNLRAPHDNWLVSETTSPVDYSPILTATTFSRGGSDGAMQLAINCRRGRTELVVAGPAVLRSAEEYTISYRLNADPPVQLAAVSPSFGSGVAVRGDVVRLLQSLPEEGSIAVRLTMRTGAALEGHFMLGGLKIMREKIATACRWPHAVARPGN